ncbi:hypothetical protein [Paracoccus sp. NSM]|uniref:hypothetical protein n=1 Tax=Paracoccus sp. NSM TaxID=3457784 RepID=UPI0040353BD4
MTNAGAAPDTTLRLARCGARDAGAAYGLKRGDLLIGLDGAPWQGGADALSRRVAAAGRPVALTFQRGTALVTVMVRRADLGPWERAPLSQITPADQPLPDPLGLVNWEIMRRADGTHELFSRSSSMLALIAPALWLAQMRLWTWLATLILALALALSGGPLLMLAVWFAAGLHLWRAAAGHLRAARLAEGYRPLGIIAARTEAEACRLWAELHPGARFRFGGAVPPAEAQALG